MTCARCGGSLSIWPATVATIHETPFFGDPDDFFIRVLEDMPLIINADLAVIDYLGSNDNVFADFTDATKLGYAGHGVGSMAASYIPGQHPELGIERGRRAEQSACSGGW